MSTVNFIPAKRRVGRKRRAEAAATPLTGAPILTAAEYLTSTWVRLTFDRPVSSTTPIPGDELFVNDGPETGSIWVGASITALSPMQIEVSLTEYDASAGTTTTLSASGSTEIVSAYDATPWAGVTNVELPFP
jgi:hypothetical protein